MARLYKLTHYLQSVKGEVMSEVIERVKLYYCEGRHDKVYEIELIAEGEGLFHVIGYNGRRGNQLVAQPKTRIPVPFATARRIFDQLEQAKLCHRKTPYKLLTRETFTSSDNSRANKPVANIENAHSQEKATDAYEATHLDALEL